jgi:hypothetical protein
MSDDEDGGPVTCDHCDQPASAYVEVETAISRDDSEEFAVYVCPKHEKWARKVIAGCDLAERYTEGDDWPSGESVIRISPEPDTDPSNPEQWKTCAACAETLDPDVSDGDDGDDDDDDGDDGDGDDGDGDDDES